MAVCNTFGSTRCIADVGTTKLCVERDALAQTLAFCMQPL